MTRARARFDRRCRRGRARAVRHSARGCGAKPDAEGRAPGARTRRNPPVGTHLTVPMSPAHALSTSYPSSTRCVSASTTAPRGASVALAPTVSIQASRPRLRGDTARQHGAWSAVAVPIVSDGHVIGVTRVAEARSDVNHQVWKAWSFLGLLGLAVLVITAVLAYWQSRRLTRPLTRLAAASTRLGDGDFTVRNETSGIAEIDAVGHALDLTAERLGDAIERERSFSADASHQLRTPLTSLRLTLERAERRPRRRPRTPRRRGRARSTSLTTRSRNCSRSHGTLTTTQALLTRVRSLPRSSISGPRSSPGLVVRLSSRSTTARRRRGRRKTAVLHIVDTLLDNAAKHGAGTVEVRARAAHRALTIEVTDEGDGITGDPELIFRRRHRTGGDDGSTSAQGPGIGLASHADSPKPKAGRLVLSVARPRPRFSLFLPVPEEANTPGAQDEVDTQNQQRSLRRASSDER